MSIKIQTANLEGLTIVANINGRTYEYGADRLVYNSTTKLYELVITDLTVSEMRDQITFVAYQNGEQVSKTLTYSVQSYAYTQLNSASATANLKALIKEMIKYGDAVAAYNASQK